jgi:DivIVA domain-containing protein
LQEEIARIRAAQFGSGADAARSFALSRRGYDREQVDSFLADLADRLEQAELDREGPAPQPGSEAVRRELELMSKKTAELLAQAEESAERLRSEATQEASRVLARVRDEARGVKESAQESRDAALAESERVTREADAYAERVRTEADTDAQALRSQAAAELAEASERAQVEARASVQAEDQERSRLSDELAELAARRDAAREELRKIAGVLADAVGAEPGPAEQSAEAEPPAEQSAAADPAPADPDPAASQAPLRAV